MALVSHFSNANATKAMDSKPVVRDELVKVWAARMKSCETIVLGLASMAAISFSSTSMCWLDSLR